MDTAGLLRNKWGDSQGLNAFFEMLDTPKDNVGFYSALLKVRCLEECGWPNQLKKFKLYEQEIQFWCEKFALEPQPHSMIKHLIETFEISPQGAKYLLIPRLVTYLSSENREIRRAAVKALGRIGHADPQSIIPLLLESLKDEHYVVRIAAKKALDNLGEANPQAIPPSLNDVLKKEKDKGKKAISKILGQVGQIDPQTVIPSLIDALQDKSSWLRRAATEALGQVGQIDPQAVIPSLIQALKDKDHDVRQSAAKALGKVGKTNPQAVIPSLIQTLKDEEYGAESAAAKALQKYDISSYLKSCPYILDIKYHHGFLISTPLTSLITCYQKDRSLYSKAIAIKCIEENLPIFQQEYTLCFYEQGKLYTVNFLKLNEVLVDIEEQVRQFPNPKIVWKDEVGETKSCSIQ
ncbi:MAG: HEAT repeat domain-containing protein [Parachlamydiaceae bacterium]|nr:HEAT repeat domain-containing protein [Parachlamydiaceae bacterium]